MHTLEQTLNLYNQPFMDLVFQAQKIHRENWNPNEVQVSTLLSIKTGGCAEDCKYCPQSSHYQTEVDASKLLGADVVLREAKKAKDAGSSRFCMGAAWREPKDRDMPKIIEILQGVKSLGLETCMTLGMLSDSQAKQLADAGLDYYNHNLDTSEDFYHNVITTRTYNDRLETLDRVRDNGMKVCCGGIVGMGEKIDDRLKMLITLANMPTHPESVPINMLVKVKGTPYQDNNSVEPIDFIRTIAVARILMPKSHVRLSAGREEMSDEMQALCFLAGANSIFYGEKLLTTPNPKENKDLELFAKLGINIEQKIESVQAVERECKTRSAAV
jgi:biotin synthase